MYFNSVFPRIDLWKISPEEYSIIKVYMWLEESRDSWWTLGNDSGISSIWGINIALFASKFAFA